MNLSILPVLRAQSFQLSPSTSIPSHILPIVGTSVSYMSTSQDLSIEMFGMGKDEEEKAGETKQNQDKPASSLLSFVLLNHDHTASLFSIKSGECIQLADDVLTAFLIHSPSYPSFASTCVVLYGKHRYNVFFIHSLFHSFTHSLIHSFTHSLMKNHYISKTLSIIT